MPMIRSVEYLKYLWRSSNEHGVHSPFVFNWVTRAIYGRQHFPLHPVLLKTEALNAMPGKDQKALNRSLHYHFGPKDLTVINCSQKEITTPEEDFLMFLDLTKKTRHFSLKQVLNTLENDTLLLVRKEGEPSTWKKLKAHPEIHLTLDCFHIGYAMKRKQQAKENFIIRL